MTSQPPATEQAEEGEAAVVAWLQFRNDREDGGEGANAAWERLRSADEAILEAHLKDKGKSAAIFGGRWEAHLGDAAPDTGGTGGGTAGASAAVQAEVAAARGGVSKAEAAEAAVAAAACKSAAAASMGTIRARYYDEADRLLARSTWCYRYWPNGVWAPFCQADDTALERMWVAMNVAGVKPGGEEQAREYTTADGQYVLRMSLQPDGQVGVGMRAVESSWNPFKNLSWYAHRGWAGAALPSLSDLEAAYEARPAGALVLVVHGMGEAFWSVHKSIGSIRDACVSLRGLAAATAAQHEAEAARAAGGDGEAGGEGNGKGAPSKPGGEGVGGTGVLSGRVEFLPIEWHTCVRGPEGDSMKTLLQVTPPSVPYLRQIANDVVMDVLFYQQESHRSRMQGFVAERMNTAVSTWCKHNPSFSGPILILGHSLGSLICFDLLQPEAELPPASEMKRETEPKEETELFLESELNKGSTLNQKSELVPEQAPLKPAEHTAEGGASAPATPALGAPQPACPPPSAPPPSAHPPSAHPPSAPPLHFRPEAFVGIGSPVGCFVALRGAPLGPAFRLGRTDRYFNVYHRNDVVAYRIEPLLVSPGAKAGHPAYVPFFGGGADGKRLHVKVKQTVRFISKAAVSVQSWLTSSSSSIKDKVLAAAQAIDGATISSFARPAPNVDEVEASVRERTEQYALNRGEPVDWVLQETEFEAANEYLSAAAAHTSYFENADVAAFLLRHVLAGATMQPATINRRESM